jgi:formylglycine-generating enzyme required for sulfatase activity
MRDARFQIPGPALLAKVVDKLDKLDMGDRDTKGDVYEYMLAKIASAKSGQRHCSRRVGRGGSWRNESELVRAAVRKRRHTNVRFDTLGFRVAKTTKP